VKTQKFIRCGKCGCLRDHWAIRPVQQGEHWSMLYFCEHCLTQRTCGSRYRVSSPYDKFGNYLEEVGQ
jgi:hypothetical protein